MLSPSSQVPRWNPSVWPQRKSIMEAQCASLGGDLAQVTKINHCTPRRRKNPTKPLKQVQKVDELTIDGTCYQWHEVFRAYVYTDEPNTIGFTFKSITDRSSTGHTEQEHLVYLAELRHSLGFESWSGELHWQCGDSTGKAQLAH